MLNNPASLDLVFHALSDPTRRAMIARLDRGPASVSELARPLSISLPAVMQHLDVLTASGLVRTEKEARLALAAKLHKTAEAVFGVTTRED